MQIINHRVYGFNQFHCCNHHLLLHSQQQTKKGVRIMQELKKTFFHKKPPWTKASLILLQKDSASLKSPPCFSLTIITIQQADFGHHNQKFYQINFVALHKNVQMHRKQEWILKFNLFYDRISLLKNVQMRRNGECNDGD